VWLNVLLLNATNQVVDGKVSLGIFFRDSPWRWQRVILLLDQLLQVIQIYPGSQALLGDLEVFGRALLVLLFDLQVIELLLPPTHPAGNCVLVAALLILRRALLLGKLSHHVDVVLEDVLDGLGYDWTG